jgi:hypothetical protein
MKAAQFSRFRVPRSSRSWIFPTRIRVPARSESSCARPESMRQNGSCAGARRSTGPTWAEFVPFLQFDAEIRKIVCTTDAIESVNARIRRAVKARGHFPNEAAALKCVYMAIMSLDPTGTGRRRWSMRWKPALNAFDIAFDGRLSAGRN